MQQPDTPPLRFWLAWFALLVVVLLLIAAPLMANTSPDELAVGFLKDLGPTGGLGAVAYMIWWMGRQLIKLHEQMLDGLKTGIEEMRRSREAMDAARREFQGGRSRVYQPTIRPDPDQPNP